MAEKSGLGTAFQIVHALGSLALSVVNPIAGAAVYAAGELTAQYLLFPPRSETFGPRTPLQQTSGSIIGSFRPLGYGRCRVPGKMIWQLGNSLQEHVSRQGSGVKGGQGVTTYSYSTTAAFLWGEGPAVSVTKIWGDGKLFYSWDGVNPSSVQEKYPGVVRSYVGEETQDPDPTIESGSVTVSGYAMVAGGSGYAVNDTGGIGGGNDDMGYRVTAIGGGGSVTAVQLFGGSGYVVGPTYPLHRGGTQQGNGNNASLRITTTTSGATQVPAWRDTCYTVFDVLPLGDFGNHLPLMTAEVTFSASPVQVSTILHDLCTRAGLTDSQIDVSRVAPTIEGYVLLSRPTARSAMQPLLDTFLIDCVETDGQLVFVPRGQPSLFALGSANLAAHEPQTAVPPALALTRLQEVDIPERVELTYIDSSRNYDATMQYGARIGLPQPTQFSRGRRQVQTPIVMSASQAKQQAQKMLYSAWVGREQATFTAPRALSRLNPTDVITIDVGTTAYTVRLTQSDVGAQGLQRWQGISEQASVFTVTTPGTTVPTPPPFIAPPATSTLLVLDTALLSSQDDDLGLYFAAASTDVSWNGATLWWSLDGTSGWQQVLVFSSRATYGTAATVLGTRPPYNTWDRANTVTITLGYGSVPSYSPQAVVLGTANAALLGQEIIQWQTATQLDAVTWRLSMLLRGRRGTEWAIGTHAVGERFVLLDPQTIGRSVPVASDVNQTRYYRLVSAGQTVADVASVAVVNGGEAQRCYAPDHIRGHRDMSNNLTITWRPRTRLPWETLNGQTGPLGEQSEQYRVTIPPALGAPTVLRSWSVTTPTVTYAATDQATDGFTPGALIPVQVQQVNVYTGSGHLGARMV